MSAAPPPPLEGMLILARKVLAAEEEQGCRNRAAVGGVYRFFHKQFDGLDLDVAGALFVQGLLRDLRRYEDARSVEERRALLAIMLRRVTEAQGGAVSAARAVPTGAVDETHRGDAPAIEQVRARARVLPDAAIMARRTPASSRPSGDGDSVPTQPGAEGGHVVDAPLLESDAGPVTTATPPGAALGVSAPVPRRPRTATPAAPAPKAVSLEQPLTEALKVRPQEAEKLVKLGLSTVEDALYHFPRDHYDFRHPLTINKLRLGMTTMLVGTLKDVSSRTTARKSVVVEARIEDATGAIRVSWFNQRFVAAQLRPRVGQRIAISGRTELYNTRLQFAPRDYEFPDDDEATHTGRLVPVYGLTEGLTQRWTRGFFKRVLDAALHLVEDPLPPAMRAAHDLPALDEALAGYHFPEDEERKAASVRRLAFDELLYIGVGMARRKRAWQDESPARPVPVDPEGRATFERALPFALTGAQGRVLSGIVEDMARETPMSRLLQGDVGSGKTVVAAAALYLTVKAGWQGALMAPTEVLADQHARSLGKLLGGLGINVELLTGSVKGRARKRIYEGMADGSLPVLVGTQALIQEGVVFDRLALAVVDEQHRFGVGQRAALRQKGYNPHVLAMTATPIPRTLSLTIYGDLDVSVIDERPPGRQPIETRWAPSDTTAYRVVREQVSEGRQAYVICPLVEESETSEARAATAEQRRLQKDVFPDLTVGLVHGRMKASEKEAALAAFRDGATQVLVATSVVEVGIDVPNATVMVVQEANMFGLAQLHQFRGRVGRGAAQSYCLLLAPTASSVAQERLGAIVGTDDGFKLAEEDLRLRGPGEFWGTRQSGLPELRVAGLGDMRLVEEARDAALALIEDDPSLERPEHRLLARKLAAFWLRDNGSERS